MISLGIVQIMATLSDQVTQIIYKRYPDYDKLPNGERVLLAMSVLANDINVEEEGGNNKGVNVKEILASTKTAEGAAWCAASIEFCFQIAGVKIGPKPGVAAAFLQWRSWGEASSRTRSKPARGLLCVRVKQVTNKKGKKSQNRHIGIVASIDAKSGNVISYEGNTSSGATGSQNDGGGLYRRSRKPDYWTGYIELDEPTD